MYTDNQYFKEEFYNFLAARAYFYFTSYTTLLAESIYSLMSLRFIYGIVYLYKKNE